jgi:hypothetical protein
MEGETAEAAPYKHPNEVLAWHSLALASAEAEVPSGCAGADLAVHFSSVELGSGFCFPLPDPSFQKSKPSPFEAQIKILTCK